MTPPHSETSAFLSAAVDAVRAAGTVALARRRGLAPARLKGTRDLVTEADLECDRLIRERLHAQFPGHDFLSEEEGMLDQGSEYRWIIDPIDGTVNYAHGIPLWGVSVGLSRRGEMLCGAVYLPVFDELYTAAAGAGARLNGSLLRVSAVDRLLPAVVSHGDFNVGAEDARDGLNADNRKALERLVASVQRVKCLGSAVVEGAYVAGGRLDGYAMTSLNPWDVAVTSLLVAEAGGRVTDLRGAPWTLAAGDALFSNGCLHDALLEALAWAR